jgi:hypothetical protein
MGENDESAAREATSGGLAGSSQAPDSGPPGAQPPVLTPFIVEPDSGGPSVVWLRAVASELVTGAVFEAQGRHWVITGVSPSGVTYRCREVPLDPTR